MTDQEFYERQRQINESWRPLTPEQVEFYARGMANATPEEIVRQHVNVGPKFLNDPFVVKMDELEQRAQAETEHRFTKWCRGARRWE